MSNQETHKDLNPEETLEETLEEALEAQNEAVEGEIVEVSKEDRGALEAELSKARSEAAEYLEGWQRARAEFANYKKRVERDQALVYQNAASSVIRRYVEVIDDLERALKNRPQEGEGLAWAGGIELIYRKFLAFLESEGVTQTDPTGEMFDPNLHEAVTSEDSPDHESGQIIEVLQKGYLIGDRVLRPAMVRVAR
jgi:molecular chaperone GrpE